MDGKIEIVKPETLRTQVENAIRDAIITGKFTHGERLVERELCEALNVSRTSVREALRKLEAEKLIKIIPHKGPIIPLISLEEAKEIYAVRFLLEGYAAKEFTQLAPEDAIEAFGEEIDQLKQCFASGDRLAVLRSKTALYEIIAAHCGNSIIEETLNALHSRISILRATSMTYPDRAQHTLLELENLYLAFKTRDANLAEKNAQCHIQNAEKVALQVLRQKHQSLNSTQ